MVGSRAIVKFFNALPQTSKVLKFNSQVLKCCSFTILKADFTTNPRSSIFSKSHSKSPLPLLKSNFLVFKQFSSQNNEGHKNSKAKPQILFEGFLGKNNFQKLQGSSLGFLILAILAGFIFLVVEKDKVSAEQKEEKRKKKLVILGSGWGALSVLKSIDSNEYDIVMVSPTNYHLFTPLLPSAAVGTVDHKSITEPIRAFIKRKKIKCQFYEAAAQDINFQTHEIICEDISEVKPHCPKFTIPYDYLVIAVGSKTNTFGVPGVEKYAHFLKTVEDSTKIKTKILDCFETADLPNVPEEERRKLLHFLVVGGGPTGVEFAAELHDYFVDDLMKHYPKIVPDVRISLVQHGDHILNTYDQSISDYTEKRFQREGIQIITKTQVIEVHENGVVLQDHKENRWTIPCCLIVWSTGISPAPLIGKIIDSHDNQSHQKVLLTDPYLRVLDKSNVFALGDCASVHSPKLLERFLDLFKEADKDNSGSLSLEEFRNLVQTYSPKYRQIAEYGKKIESMFIEADVDQDKALSLKEFKDLLKKVDSNLTQFPATAQVASQQGKYVAHFLNNLAKNKPNDSPFIYKHLGSLAYVGSNRSVADFGSGWALSGLATWWLWRSIYWSELIGYRAKVSLAFDWIKEKIFGRDLSRF